MVPPNVLRSPEAYSPMLALARMIAPALRRRATISASAGGRSLAKSAAAPLVERMSKVSNWSLIANGMPCSGPLRRPVRANSASSAFATSSASGMLGSLSAVSVFDRLPRMLSVMSAPTRPAFSTGSTSPSIRPVAGSGVPFTQAPL